MIGYSDERNLNAHLSGQNLYGEDFDHEQIEAWFNDEAEGYFELIQTAGGGRYVYGYHALNKRHGFAKLPMIRFSNVLGVGAAYGKELEPILPQIDCISILDPSDHFAGSELNGVPVVYIKPIPSGIIPVDSGSIDLVTCLGVLHHIPNVSKIINELYRVLRPGGFALVREPIISMGDWRKPRAGLTKHERGIPLPLFRDFISRAGFDVLGEKKCMFSLTSRLRYVMTGPVFNSAKAVALDDLLSALPIWSKTYHARNILQKFRPTAVYYVLKKPAGIV